METMGKLTYKNLRISFWLCINKESVSNIVIETYLITILLLFIIFRELCASPLQ